MLKLAVAHKETFNRVTKTPEPHPRVDFRDWIRSPVGGMTSELHLSFDQSEGLLELQRESSRASRSPTWCNSRRRGGHAANDEARRGRIWGQQIMLLSKE